MNIPIFYRKLLYVHNARNVKCAGILVVPRFRFHEMSSFRILNLGNNLRYLCRVRFEPPPWQTVVPSVGERPSATPSASGNRYWFKETVAQSFIPLIKDSQANVRTRIEHVHVLCCRGPLFSYLYKPYTYVFLISGRGMLTLLKVSNW